METVQETDRRLREEQDAEYQRSLEADRQVRIMHFRTAL